MKTNRLYFLLSGFLAISSYQAFSQDYGVAPDSLRSAPGHIADAGAVSTARGEDLYKSATPNLTNTFSGRLPGLFTVNGGGTPGYDIARMYVRGIGSYAQGTGSTLKFFVDGFEVKEDYIQYLSPEEIESVSVLKDAASLATFGMNGANGILLIETKRGSIGAPVITFRARSGLQQPINVAKPLGAYEYAGLYNQAVSNDKGEWAPFYGNAELEAYRNGQGTDVSWYDEVFRGYGIYSDGSLSFRGGSHLATYNVILDYANQQGLFNVQNTDRNSNAVFVKYGVRTNLDMRLNKILSVSVDIGGRLEDRRGPNYGIWQLVQDVMSYPSNIYPIFDEMATDPISKFSGTATHPNNPVGSLTGMGWTTSRTKVLQANFKFKEDLGSILKGLYLQEGFSFYSKTVGNTGKTRTYARYMGGTAQTSDQSTYIRSNGYWSSGKERWIQGNVTLGYGNIFGSSAIDADINAHISDYNGYGSSFYDWKYRYVNYSGRINYSYKERYVAGLAVSYFGSDAYAPGKRYVLYPAAPMSWIATNESFLKSQDVVRFLKFRASAGFTGASGSNTQIPEFETGGRFLYQQYYATTGGFETGFGPSFGWGASAFGPLFTANPEVTAEKSLKADAGFDLNIAGRLDITGGVFLDKRSGILTLDNSLMDYYATKQYYANIGRMTNGGGEISLVFTGKAGELGYSFSGNALYAVNRVDEMGEVKTKYPYNASTGLPLGTRMGLECTGFYKQGDFDLDGALKEGLPVPLFGKVQPGDLRYKDQDGDGYIDETDIVKIGNPDYPRLAFSLGGDFTFKGFDLSFLITDSAGSSVNLLDYSAWKPFIDYGNAFKWARQAWVYYPEAGLDTRETATFPRLTTMQNDNNYRPSSFWIRSNNFIRLQNVEFGFDFSTLRAVRKAGMPKCRLYINALNLLTLSSLLSEYDIDPETADYGYPALKSYNIGVRVNF